MLTFFYFITGLVLRLAGALTSRCLWGDEWSSVEVARTSLQQVVLLNAVDRHPPLYFLWLHSFIRLLGPYEWAFRLPSTLAGIGALAGIYLFSREFFDRKTAAATLFLAAFSPYLLHLSGEVRNHGCALLFTSFGSFFYVCWLKSGKKKWGWAYSIAAIAAVYTTHLTWFWVLGLFAMHIWFVKKKRLSSETLIFQVGIVLLGLPALGIMLYHTPDEALFYDYFDFSFSDALKQALHRLASIFWYFETAPVFLVDSKKELSDLFRNSAAFYLALAAFFSTAAIMLSYFLKRKNSKDAVLAAFFLSPIAFIAVVSSQRLDPRYYAFIYPVFLIWIARAWIYSDHKFLKITAAVLLLSSWIYGDSFVLRSSTDPFNRENYTDLARFVSAHFQKDDLVYNKTAIIDYYLKKMGLKTYATLSSDEDNNPETLRHFKRVWLLDGTAADSPYFPVLETEMKKYGFVPRGREIRFGEKIVINLFVNPSKLNEAISQ